MRVVYAVQEVEEFIAEEAAAAAIGAKEEAGLERRGEAVMEPTDCCSI